MSSIMGSTSVAKLAKIRNFNEIPGPKRIPLWGTLYLYKLGVYKQEKYHEALIEMFRKYGPLVREDFGPKNTVIHAFDPLDAKTVFAQEGPMPRVEPLQETTQLYRKIKKTSPGLGNTNGEEWYRLRSAVRKMMLRPKEVQVFLPQVNEISNDLVKKLHRAKDQETNEISNLRQEIGKWSREGWICFRKRLGCFAEQEKQAEKMIQINRKIFQLSSKLKFSLPVYKAVSTPAWRKLVQLEELVHGSVIDLIRESSDEGSFLHFLKHQESLSPEDVEVLILSVFGDGLSTTVPSLIYNLYLLSRNPEVQEEVRKEVREAADNDNITSDAINNKLHLLKACVKESFRMYPIGTEISRIIEKDLILSNYHVPKGTHVHLNQMVQFRSDSHFEHPERFHPRRWLRSNAEDIEPVLLVPFGHGTRTCAGRRFAEQDLYVALSKILLNFRLGYPETSALEQVYEVLLFPKEPIRIKFEILK